MFIMDPIQRNHTVNHTAPYGPYTYDHMTFLHHHTIKNDPTSRAWKSVSRKDIISAFFDDIVHVGTMVLSRIPASPIISILTESASPGVGLIGLQTQSSQSAFTNGSASKLVDFEHIFLLPCLPQPFGALYISFF
jgi:hypothetical protein